MSEFTERPNISFNFSKSVTLLLDGSPTGMEVSVQILSGFGFRKMHRCNKIAKAVDITKTASLDLVLIDPYSYGAMAYEFIRWLRSEQVGPNSDVPIILVTGQTEIQNITSARDCGADFVVAKPFSPAVLLERVLWVAMGEGRRGGLIAPPALVTATGSGVELW